MSGATAEFDGYFNPRRAVRRLCSGESAVQVFEHPQLPPLHPVTWSEIRIGRVYPDFRSGKIKKAISNTLITAASADLSHLIAAGNHTITFLGRDYNPNTRVNNQVVDGVFLPQFKAVEDSLLRRPLNEFYQGKLETPIFNKVVEALQEFLQATPDQTRQAAGYKLAIEGHTLAFFMPAYLFLLRDLFAGTEGHFPDVLQTTEMIGNSVDILHFFAPRSIAYMESGVSILAGVDEGPVETMRFNPKDFQLFQPPDHPLSAKLRAKAQPKIERKYRQIPANEYQENFNITGCPANPELIDVLIQKYVEAIKINASPK